MEAINFRRSLAIGLLILFAGVIGMPSNGSATLDQGLMGYWKFDECSGNIVHDSSGHGNNGTIYGGTWVNGISGCALGIVDTQMVRSIPISFDDSINSALTVTAWVKWYGPNSYNSGSMIFDGRNSGATGGFAFFIGADGTLGFHMHQAGSAIQSICRVPADSTIWSHVAAVFDDNSDTLCLFINGKQVKVLTTTVSYIKSNLTAAMGNNRWAPGDHQWTPLNGALDEVRIYNRALSAAEIQMLYNPGSGLVGYWNFDEGSGDTLHDYSGHNNHGVISGASWTSGESGSALELVGTNIVQYIPSSFDDSITSLTIVAWVKWYGPSAYYERGHEIFDGRGSGDNNGFAFYIGADSTLRFHMHQSGSEIHSIHRVPTDTSWTHVAVVFDDDSNTLRAFINGCLDTSLTSIVSYNRSDLSAAMGNNRWAPPWAPLNGILDEVRIYNRALSKAEIGLLSCSYIHRGDFNIAGGDGVIALGDVVYLIDYLFRGGPPPDPLAAGDVNCDFAVDLGDVVYLISYLYKSGLPPCSCSKNSTMSSTGLQQSLNKIAKTASVGLGQIKGATDDLFEIPLEGKVDMEVAGLQFDIGYDPNFVTLLDPVLTSRTEGLQVFSNAKDGIQRIGIVDLSGQNYIPAGESPLIILRGKGTDLSSIKIKEAILVDKDANKIPVEIVSEMKKGEEGSDAKESIVPKDFSLSQNLPNPFNPETEISYDLPNACHVTLSIYNLLGQRIRSLVDEYQTTGHKTIRWDGRDDQGIQVASGIYFYQIQAGDFTDAKKMILMK